ncbi:MAG: arylsulfatase A [Saprospiraceae bacterium]|jgi:arylsulfatase A
MIKYGFQVIVLLLIVGCSSFDNSNSVEERATNFVIIFADDLGYGDLGPYGHPTIHTPHLDKMANEGMKFTQFYVSAPVCTPSRAGLLTGRYAIRSGVADNTMSVFFPYSLGGLPRSEITIAEGLKQKDYATAIFGKWHLGHRPDYLPTKQGFDTYFGIPYSNDMSPPTVAFEPLKKLFPAMPLMEGEDIIEEEPDQTQLTKRYAERAVRFIGEQKENPFFLYVPFAFPHIPLFASEQFRGRSKRGLYGDTVEEIDWAVGQIMDALKTNGIDENTMVVFISDNGPWLSKLQEGGSSGLLRNGKGSTYEGGLRVPAIARYPGYIPEGTVSSSLASTLDLFPTLLSMAGADLPEDRIYDGMDMSIVLKDPAKSVRDEIIYYRGSQVRAIRKGSYKAHFITREKPYDRSSEVIQHEKPLLYNIDIDPSEQYDISADHPDILEMLTLEAERHKRTIEPVENQLLKIEPDKAKALQEIFAKYFKKE